MPTALGGVAHGNRTNFGHLKSEKILVEVEPLGAPTYTPRNDRLVRAAASASPNVVARRDETTTVPWEGSNTTIGRLEEKPIGMAG